MNNPCETVIEINANKLTLDRPTDTMYERCHLTKHSIIWVIYLLYIYMILFSHTFLTDNHVRLHSSQNASDTGKAYDNHLRSTAKIT